MTKNKNETHSPDLQTALKAVRAAGAIVREGFYSSVNITIKSDQSLVTEYDHRAEQALIDILGAETHFSILSEETGSQEKKGDHLWIMDPIDGTSNFSRGLGICTVSLALFDKDGARIGVIGDPLRHDMYYAERGAGAFCNDQPIHVSDIDDARKSLIILECGHPPRDRQLMSRVWRRLAHFDVRQLGSTAYELCTVACGKTDAFICAGDQIWDYAAGMLIVTEAGGRFCNWNGEPWQESNPHIYASNSYIDDLILPNIQDLQQ
ncbi:MAG: inositol monophosphatase family protein [candidate division KSB1 bacterium]|nr:inositol monophosphatase family protein [candidate division KSB1 bacterium]